MIEILEDPEAIILQAEPRLYLFKGKPYKSVTGIIGEAGFGPDFSMVNEKVMATACDRGSKVHLACSYLDDGDLNLGSVHSSIRGYVDADIKFRRECPIKVIASEKRMVNTRLGLAGTPDVICFMRGHRVIIDRKTSQSVHPSMGLQTAGYKILWEVQHPNQLIHGRYGLKLLSTGQYRLIPHEDTLDMAVFMDALNYVKAKEIRDRWLPRYSKLAA